MTRAKTIPTILGILVLVIGVGVGVALTQFSTIFSLQASPDTTPSDVRITNVSDTSFTVSWTTEKETTGALDWGADPALGRTQTPPENALSRIHSLTLRSLVANTTYYFKINSAGAKHDNNGVPWQIKTGTKLTASSNKDVISGTVVDAQGQAVGGALVYINAVGMAPLSSKTSSNGSWVLPLTLARQLDNSAYMNLQDETLLQVLVQSATNGVSTAQIFLGSSYPIPKMTLGETHDFRTTQNQSSNDLPESSLDVPENEVEQKSKFQLGEEISTDTSAKVVSLDSIEEDEVITTSEPEFFGEGPPGTQITLTVESDPVTEDITVPTNGNWKWTPPTNLPAGEHKITISWKDASGVLRKLTRNFVVSAQEGVAFESTPTGGLATASPTARPSSSPTVKPSSSPTVKPSASPTSSASATPRVSIPSTDSGTPVAGSLTPTLLLSIMGIGLVILGIFASIKASNI